MTNETHTNEIPAIDSLKQLGAEWAALGLSFGSQAIGRSALTLRLAARSLNVLGGVLGDAATKLRGEMESLEDAVAEAASEAIQTDGEPVAEADEVEVTDEAAPAAETKPA